MTTKTSFWDDPHYGQLLIEKSKWNEIPMAVQDFIVNQNSNLDVFSRLVSVRGGPPTYRFRIPADRMNDVLRYLEYIKAGAAT